MLPSLTVLQVVLLSIFTLVTPFLGATHIDENYSYNYEATVVSDIVLGDPIITGAYCDLNNGTITTTVISGPTNLEYAIQPQGGALSAWQSSPLFDNLGVNDYLIYIRDADDWTCFIITTAQIPDAPDLTIVDFNFVCQPGVNAADFSMSVTGGTAEYTLTYDQPGGGGVYTTTSFNDIIPFEIANIVTGNYTIYIEDRLGCVKDTTFFVQECCTFDFICNNPPIIVDCIGDYPEIDSIYTDGITDGYSDLDSLVAQNIIAINANCYEGIVTATDTPLNTPTECVSDTLKINRTYTIDQNGTEYVCVQEIFVLNHLAPSFAAEAENLVVECDGQGNLVEIQDWINANGGAQLNECSPVTWSTIPENIVISDLCGETGQAEVMFHYVDQCGNRDTTSALVVIEDTTAPTISCVDDLIMPCGFDDDMLNAWLTSVTGTDDCNPGASVISHDYFQFVPNCGMSGETEVTFTSTDDCGNFSTCVANIIVVDPNAFQVLCPSDLQVDLDDPNLLNTINTWLELATTDDPCYEVDYPVVNDFDASLLDVQCDYLSILVTFTSVNDCGIEKSCSAQIVASQSIGATINCPEPLVLQCGDINNEDLVNAWLVTASAEDHEGTNIPLDNNFNFVETACGITDITFSGIDNCGQSVNCASQIIIEDLQKPVINCPADLNLSCGEDTAAIDEWLNSVTAEDQCGIAFITNDADAVDFTLTCGDSGHYEVTFTATDVCGNTEECVARINIFDDSNIDIMCPPNLLLDESVTDIDAEVQAWLAMAQVVDPCNLGLQITNNYGDETITFDCGFIMGEVTFEIASNCGAVATCTATVSGNVDVTPTITCAEDITLSCGDTANESIIVDWIGSVTAQDFAGFDLPVTNNLDDLGAICGEVTVEFTAEDDCDNVLTCTHMITIEDNITPEIVCQSERVVDLSIGSAQSQIDEIIANTSLLDNCSQDVSLSYELNVDIDNIGCGDVEMMTLIATDDCGNSTVCETEVSFIDYNDIYIDCPDPLSVSCLEENLEEYIEDYLNSVDVQTSRLPADLTHDFDPSMVSDDCNDYISFEVEFVAIDECGTTQTCVVPVEILPEMKTFVPNIFTPDGDGLNDLVTVYANKNVVIVKEWFIYDRWGEIVFRSFDFNPNEEDLGWNGMFRGRMGEQNVYTYIMTVQDDYGREETSTGTITLMN